MNEKTPEDAGGKCQGSVNISIDSDTQTRKGAFADFAMARTDGQTTVLDFVLNDMPISQDESRGVLTARVFMSNSGLLGLRDMLVEYTRGWDGGSATDAS